MPTVGMAGVGVRAMPTEPATFGCVINDFAKEYLHEDLRWVRQSVLDKLEGLSTTYGAL